MISILTAVTLFTCASQSLARTIPTSFKSIQLPLSNPAVQNHPEPLTSSMTATRKPVPGDNTAVYCGSTAPEDQLFKIDELTVTPNPPESDKRFFVYLKGTAPDDPALKDVRLKLTGFHGDEKMGEYEDRLSAFPPIIIRKNWEYSKELKAGNVELLADQALYSHFIQEGDYSLTAEATFPDGRVLFCFEGGAHLKGDA